jgi:hypothetical protein
LPVRTQTRVVERVHEHPPTELAVRDDVKAEVDLSLNDLTDGGVLELSQRAAVFLSFLVEDRRVTPLVEGINGTTQRSRSKERADNLGSSGGPVRTHIARLNTCQDIRATGHQ